MASPYYKVFTEKTCIPEPILLLGSLTTRGTIVTLANAKVGQILVGDYIYDENQNEVRKITGYSGNNLVIESAFTVDITTAIGIVVAGRTLFTSVSITNIGLTDGELNNDILKKRSIVNYENSDGVTPITIDGTGTQIAISGL